MRRREGLALFDPSGDLDILQRDFAGHDGFRLQAEHLEFPASTEGSEAGAIGTELQPSCGGQQRARRAGGAVGEPEGLEGAVRMGNGERGAVGADGGCGGFVRGHGGGGVLPFPDPDLAITAGGELASIRD